MLAWAGQFEIAAAAFVGAYFGNGVAGPVERELLHAQVDERVRTTVLSIESMTLQGGGLAAGIGLGALADAAGMSVAFMVGAAVLALSSLLYLRVDMPSKDPDAAIQAPTAEPKVPSPNPGAVL